MPHRRRKKYFLVFVFGKNFLIQAIRIKKKILDPFIISIIAIGIFDKDVWLDFLQLQLEDSFTYFTYFYVLLTYMIQILASHKKIKGNKIGNYKLKL